MKVNPKKVPQVIGANSLVLEALRAHYSMPWYLSRPLRMSEADRRLWLKADEVGLTVDEALATVEEIEGRRPYPCMCSDGEACYACDEAVRDE